MRQSIFLSSIFLSATLLQDVLERSVVEQLGHGVLVDRVVAAVGGGGHVEVDRSAVDVGVVQVGSQSVVHLQGDGRR